MQTPTHPSSPDAAPKPRRPFVWTSLRRLCLGLATLAVAIGLFYGIENWRGWRAWSAERAAVLKNRTPLELAEMVPPVVADDQNLAQTEPFLTLFDWKRGVDGRWSNTNLEAGQSWCDLSSINGGRILPGVGNWTGVGTGGTNRVVNLAEWQKFFRAPAQMTKKHVVDARRRRGLPDPEVLPTRANVAPTNGLPGYPLSRIAGRPAEDVLQALKVFDTELTTVADGTRRPEARFPIRYEDGPSALLPHLAMLKKLSTVLTLRGTARLDIGETAGALDDLRAALVLAETSKNEPLLISQMVRHACLTIALQTAWEGQIQHRWSPAQLETIQGWLAQIDVQPGMRRALAGERIMVTGIVRTILASAQGRRDMAGMFSSLSIFSVGGNDAAEYAPAYLFWAPRGWLYASAAEISRALRTLETTAPAELSPLVGTWPPPSPSDSMRFALYRTYLRPDLRSDSDGGWVHSLLKAHRAQAQVRLAQTACALERHRIEQGNYPDRLEALVPRWLSAIPADPIDQQPLRYARDGDDRFRLWSIADNARDDGGTSAKSPESPLSSLDWVWHWPSP